MLHKIKIMGMGCFYLKGLEYSRKSFNSDCYIEAGRMNKSVQRGIEIAESACSSDDVSVLRLTIKSLISLIKIDHRLIDDTEELINQIGSKK